LPRTKRQATHRRRLLSSSEDHATTSTAMSSDNVREEDHDSSITSPTHATSSRPLFRTLLPAGQAQSSHEYLTESTDLWDCFNLSKDYDPLPIAQSSPLYEVPQVQDFLPEARQASYTRTTNETDEDTQSTTTRDDSSHHSGSDTILDDEGPQSGSRNLSMWMLDSFLDPVMQSSIFQDTGRQLAYEYCTCTPGQQLEPLHD
jgi:hypothetical protein